MKTLFYQFTSTPLDFFGDVMLSDIDTLNPASSTRKDQRCIVEPAHPSPQQAKLKHRRTASVSRIANPSKKAKSDKKAKTAKSFGRQRQERARRYTLFSSNLRSVDFNRFRSTETAAKVFSASSHLAEHKQTHTGFSRQKNDLATTRPTITLVTDESNNLMQH